MYHYKNIISKNKKKIPDINANNNDNQKIIVCSLQNENIYSTDFDYFPDMDVDSWSDFCPYCF